MKDIYGNELNVGDRVRVTGRGYLEPFIGIVREINNVPWSNTEHARVDDAINPDDLMTASNSSWAKGSQLVRLTK